MRLRSRAGRKLLDQLLEGQVLVGVGAQRTLAHPREQLAKPRIAREVRAQHQRVDEETDEPLELGAPAPGNGRAHRDVLLPAVAVEQHLEGREQRHEQRRPFAPAQRLERMQQRRGQIKGCARAPVAQYRRTRPVGGQLQRGQISELRLPVGELALQHLALQPLALPHRVVGILDRQRRQPGLAPPHECVVGTRQLALEDAHRPAVGDDVVHVEQQQVLFGRKAQQLRAQQRARLQVEGLASLCVGDLARARLTLGLRHRAEIGHRERHRLRCFDDLHGLALAQGKARAQRLVARHQLIEAALQRRRIEPPLQPPCRGNVVERLGQATAGRETTAAAGQTTAADRPTAGRRRNRCSLSCLTRAKHLLRLCRESRYCGRLEQTPQRQLDLQELGQTGDDLGGEQRMAAQLEEVVVHADPLQLQYLAPDLGDQFLE